MSILKVELPPDLDARLDAAAGERPGEKERIVREAVEWFLEQRAGASERKRSRVLDLEPFPDGQTFGDLMKDHIGKYEGPGDLSYNKKYMEGFGES